MVTLARDGELAIAVSVGLAAEPDIVIRGRLRSVGLDLRGSLNRTIEGYIRPDRLKALAATGGVLSVRAIRTPIPDGFVSQAPAIHAALPWHQAQYIGEGVKVGILDGGFDGFVTRMGSDLPAAVDALCFPEMGAASSSIADCVEAGETHGTAVAESIIAISPGASLFVSNAASPADMAAAVRWMTSSGVRVINFSRGSPILMEGMGDGQSTYGDSTYGLVESAVSAGALFVAAAGNYGDQYWAGSIRDADSNGWLEFASDNEVNSVYVPPGETATFTLRWDSSSTDYDLTLWQGDLQVASGESIPNDPAEVIFFDSATGGTYDLAIWHRSGPDASRLRLMSSRWALAHHVATGSTGTPADSRSLGMVAVGAVNYRTPTVIEPYSSQGPTLDGRNKPDLVAVDCVDTAVASAFCGTSQAAPFVSGAAALLLEADPTLTPVALASLLKQRAVPIGSPVPNNVFGAGLLSLGPPPTPVPAAAAFLAPPASGVTASPLLGQPTIGVVDAGARVVDSGPGATMSVTLSLGNNPTGANLACEGGNLRVAAAGVAAFAGCAVDAPGAGYTLRADIPGLAPAISAPFTVLPTGSPPAASISLASTAVTIGKPVAGTVSVPATGTPPGPVTVEWSKDGKLWSLSNDIALDALGAGPFNLTPTTSRWLRVRLARADGTIDVSPSAFIRVDASAVLVSSVPTGRTVARSTKITLTETIRPIGGGAAVGKARFDFFLNVGTAWVRKRTLYANADAATGRARLVTTLPSYGSWWIRSRAEPTATNGASTWTAGYKYVVR